MLDQTDRHKEQANGSEKDGFCSRRRTAQGFYQFYGNFFPLSLLLRIYLLDRNELFFPFPYSHTLFLSTRSGWTWIPEARAVPRISSW